MNRLIELEKKSNELRNIILESSGHVASAFSCIEILVALFYGGILRYKPTNPEWEKRDRFILSKGHGSMSLYAVLGDLGYFPLNWIEKRYCKGDYFLGAHPDIKIPGVEVTTGSLGHGLGLAAGIALGNKLDNNDKFQFVLLGDGECTEGAIWEAVIFSANMKLNNLVAIVDRNHKSVLGTTEDMTNLDAFPDRWLSFGWDVNVVDGHNIVELIDALKKVKYSKTKKPSVIIAETIKGKGISFLEEDPMCHLKNISAKDELEKAKKELQWANNEQ